MLSVKGLFQDGVARPNEHVSGSDGRPAIMTFLDEEVVSLSPSEREKAWDTLAQLVEENRTASPLRTGSPISAANPLTTTPLLPERLSGTVLLWPVGQRRVVWLRLPGHL